MLKNHEITTGAVIIGRVAAGEGSVRAYFYTESLGLVSALAKSAREERSKLRPHLQVGIYGSFTFVKGVHDWRAIGAAYTRSTYFSVDTTNAQFACARVLAVLRQLIHGEEPNQELFDALWGFLESLNTLNEEDIYIAERLAMVRILASLGYVPTHPDIPHLSEQTYSKETLRDLQPFEKKLVKVINEALFVSGLA